MGLQPTAGLLSKYYWMIIKMFPENNNAFFTFASEHNTRFTDRQTDPPCCWGRRDSVVNLWPITTAIYLLLAGWLAVYVCGSSSLLQHHHHYHPEWIKFAAVVAAAHPILSHAIYISELVACMSTTTTTTYTCYCHLLHLSSHVVFVK